MQIRAQSAPEFIKGAKSAPPPSVTGAPTVSARQIAPNERSHPTQCRSIDVDNNSELVKKLLSLDEDTAQKRKRSTTMPEAPHHSTLLNRNTTAKSSNTKLDKLSRNSSFGRRLSSQSIASEFDSLVRRLPEDTEVGQVSVVVVGRGWCTGWVYGQVFAGVLTELVDVQFAMVRLAEAVFMPELMDAQLPIRFLFVILGPHIADVSYHEVGRALATLMANPVLSCCVSYGSGGVDV